MLHPGLQLGKKNSAPSHYLNCISTKNMSVCTELTGGIERQVSSLLYVLCFQARVYDRNSMINLIFSKIFDCPLSFFFRCVRLSLQAPGKAMGRCMNSAPIFSSPQRRMSSWKILRKMFTFGQLTRNWLDIGVWNLEAEQTKCSIFGSMVWSTQLLFHANGHR